MKIKFNVSLNEKPFQLFPLNELTGLIIEKGEKSSLIYLEAEFKNGNTFNPSWFFYHDIFNDHPIFFSPCTGEFFYQSEIKNAKARVLLPTEILKIQIEYCGEL